MDSIVSRTIRLYIHVAVSFSLFGGRFLTMMSFYMWMKIFISTSYCGDINTLYKHIFCILYINFQSLSIFIRPGQVSAYNTNILHAHAGAYRYRYFKHVHTWCTVEFKCFLYEFFLRNGFYTRLLFISILRTYSRRFFQSDYYCRSLSCKCPFRQYYNM